MLVLVFRLLDRGAKEFRPIEAILFTLFMTALCAARVSYGRSG